MERLPPGLSPLWLIALSLLLGTTIVTFIPISISGGEAIKSSDWIGFAGNVFAAAMTIAAAATAWFAVQRQIDAQRRLTDVQIAIQQFEQEITLCNRLRSRRVTCESMAIWQKQTSNFVQSYLQMIADEHIKNATDISAILDEFDVARSKLGPVVMNRKLRADVAIAAVDMRSLQIEAQIELRRIALAYPTRGVADYTVPQAAFVTYESIDFLSNANAFNVAADKYIDDVYVELRRLVQIIPVYRARMERNSLP